MELLNSKLPEQPQLGHIEESAHSQDVKTEDEEFQNDVNHLACAVCLARGQINDSNSFTGEENSVWKVYNCYDGIAQAGELPSKIRVHFPQVPAERLEPLDTVICTCCFTVVQNVLQIEKQMLQVKSKLLVIKPDSFKATQKPESKESHALEVPVTKAHARAKRKCALTGLPQEIINAELGLGYDKTDTADSGSVITNGDTSPKFSQSSKSNRFKRDSEQRKLRRSPLRSRLKGRTHDKKVSSDDFAMTGPKDEVSVKKKKSKKMKHKTSSFSEKSGRSEQTSNTSINVNPALQPNTDRSLVSKDSFFCCPKCCQYFSQDNYSEFRNHLSEECFVKKRSPCQLCGHIYSTQNILDYHMVHVHENPHPKSKTMKTKPRKEYVDTVSKLINRKSDGKDSLEVDSETLLRNYKELEEDEWPEDEVEAEVIAARRDAVGISLTCDSCGISFAKKFHLREHIHEVHPDNTGYTCEDCGRKFMYKNMQHVCEKIQCNICGETFGTRGLKSKHMLVHPEFRPFKCELCPKEFQKREYLTIHMRVHNDIRPYGCEFCEKRFRSKSHYNNHRRLHTGEKPYVCHNCGRSFFSPQCLYNHLTSHTGNKSSVCTTCGKAFRTSNDLKRHEYIHSGEKPFACKFCGKCFNRRGNCLVHERAHEVDGEFKCDLCSLKFEKLKKLEKHKQKMHTPDEGNKTKGTKCVTKVKSVKQTIQHTPAKSIANKFLSSEAEPVTQPVAFIHLDDVASNVEISEGILVDEGVEEPISLYQFSFEIDDNTLYCIQERRTDVITCEHSRVCQSDCIKVLKYTHQITVKINSKPAAIVMMERFTDLKKE
ncbi:unnamed protein product [Allacma fusca]|uniref:C2H2-type domain-containing protein n=1 Tax=Allacma fusca TaxID=39272 RepID=A0A8J2KZ21_9HEXA|nr:unnamed protein product [Allacma fusca]